MILPNGLSVDLPQSNQRMKALDETGALGVVSHVNRHWFMQFGAALVLGVLDGIAGYAQRDQQNTANGIVISRTSENFDRVLDRVMSQYSSILPTISVYQGKTMRIYVSDDMLISPYTEISNRSYYGNR
jgi:type IV secretory pathway VirB10-like protein